MYSHFFIGFILLIGVTAFLIKYLKTSFLKKFPQCNQNAVNKTLGLTILELAIIAFPFVALWSFLPTNPYKDSGMDFLSSDMANWEIDYEGIDVMYQMQTSFGLNFLIWGALSIGVIYFLFQKDSSNNSLIKILSIINIINAAAIVCGIGALVLTFGILSVFGKQLVEMGETAYFIFIALINIAFLVWIISKAVKIQKSFNKGLRELYVSEKPVIVSPIKNNQNEIGSEMPTRECPYCGETILAVAKKCKHCGEWIKEEDLKTEAVENLAPLSQNKPLESNDKDSMTIIWWIIGIAIMWPIMVVIYHYVSDKSSTDYDADNQSEYEIIEQPGDNNNVNNYYDDNNYDYYNDNYYEDEPSYEEYNID